MTCKDCIRIAPINQITLESVVNGISHIILLIIGTATKY